MASVQTVLSAQEPLRLPKAQLDLAGSPSTTSSTRLHSGSRPVKLKYMKLIYRFLLSQQGLYALLFVLLGAALSKSNQVKIKHHNVLITLSSGASLMQAMWAVVWGADQLEVVAAAVLVASVAAAAAVAGWWHRQRHVYLMDFACFKPADDRKVSKQYFITNSGLIGLFTKESLEFQRKILERSGLGQETYFPPAVTNLPPNPCLEEARSEAETVVFGCVDELLGKQPASFKPRDVGILIVNCSAFCPAPSLAAMIIHRYKLRGNILAYNLAGMGCSASVIACDLAKRLLAVHPATYALVVSTENITLNWYRGNNKNMLVSNCLFRMGGAAMLLSNVRADRRRAKYELLHTVRTHKGAEDKSFYCVKQEEDEEGILGVVLSRELMGVAAAALRTNITRLGPRVLPWWELARFAWSMARRRLQLLRMQLMKQLKTCCQKDKDKRKGEELAAGPVRQEEMVKLYVPDFKRAFEHFCVHAGGRAVLDEVEKRLGLGEWLMEPSRMTLFRFGNTSSSSLWYELAYLEAQGRVRKGHRVWQIGFGSGFKCNSAVWKALATLDPQLARNRNCWSDFIHTFPVHVPAVDHIHDDAAVTNEHFIPTVA